MIAYCDYIAYIIRASLLRDPDSKFGHIGRIEWDLDDDGSFQSTTKLLIIEDNNGKKYKITVEEA
jgi:hypothetical protein